MAEALGIRAHLYSIVVIGAMNPRIHHPLWYRLIGAISEQEAEAAADAGGICATPFSNFETAGMSVLCQQDRWQIVTTRADVRSRLLDVTKLVFRKLNETPVQLYGINNNFDLETTIPKVATCLTDLLIAMDVGFETEGKQRCELRFARSADDHLERTEIKPSELGNDLLFVGCNAEYLPKGRGPGYFDLGELLDRSFDLQYERSIAIAHRVLDRLTARCGA